MTVKVPDEPSVISNVLLKVTPSLWVMVKPANASVLPMASLKVIVAPVPELKVKVRSLLLALSASILLLMVIPPVAVILTLAARLISPVVVNEPLPKLKAAPLRVISAAPLSKAKLLLLLENAAILIAPSLSVLLVSIVMLAPFVVVPTNVTELPELLSVVMLPFRVVNVPEVIAMVLMLPLPPMAPTATVLAEPPDEVMVISCDPEAAVIVPILMAPPAEVTLKF